MIRGHRLVRQSTPVVVANGVFVGKCWCGIEVQAAYREAAEIMHDEKWAANLPERPVQATVPINPGDKLVLLSRSGKALHLTAEATALLEKLISEGIMSAEDYAEDGEEEVLTAAQFAEADVLVKWIRENVL